MLVAQLRTAKVREAYSNISCPVVLHQINRYNLWLHDWFGHCSTNNRVNFLVA